MKKKRWKIIKCNLLRLRHSAMFPNSVRYLSELDDNDSLVQKALLSNNIDLTSEEFHVICNSVLYATGTKLILRYESYIKQTQYIPKFYYYGIYISKSKLKKQINATSYIDYLKTL